MKTTWKRSHLNPPHAWGKHSLDSKVLLAAQHEYVWHQARTLHSTSMHDSEQRYDLATSAAGSTQPHSSEGQQLWIVQRSEATIWVDDEPRLRLLCYETAPLHRLLLHECRSTLIHVKLIYRYKQGHCSPQTDIASAFAADAELLVQLDSERTSSGDQHVRRTYILVNC